MSNLTRELTVHWTVEIRDYAFLAVVLLKTRIRLRNCTLDPGSSRICVFSSCSVEDSNPS